MITTLERGLLAFIRTVDQKTIRKQWGDSINDLDSDSGHPLEVVVCKMLENMSYPPGLFSAH